MAYCKSSKFTVASSAVLKSSNTKIGNLLNLVIISLIVKPHCENINGVVIMNILELFPTTGQRKESHGYSDTLTLIWLSICALHLGLPKQCEPNIVVKILFFLKIV